MRPMAFLITSVIRTTRASRDTAGTSPSPYFLAADRDGEMMMMAAVWVDRYLPFLSDESPLPLVSDAQQVC